MIGPVCTVSDIARVVEVCAGHQRFSREHRRVLAQLEGAVPLDDPVRGLLRGSGGAQSEKKVGKERKGEMGHRARHTASPWV